MIKNRMRFFLNKNYKPLKSPTDVSHSSLHTCQYQTWLLMKIWMCDVFLRSVQNK